ncbi:hypothetical protein U9M48_033473 [Paspalum notatum var. saurae]|uniref:GDSL esterase/lipase n=1 Tax=Paspalum notatum var. saurae TaxID=547442 RepID=A0AAQ3UAS2_PASNO
MASRGAGGRVLAALLALSSVLVLALQGAAAKPLVPAMFVFGDSLVDVGNNNHLANCNANCRANYRRYGVDLPCHSPTGRFSNGYNLADQLAQQLGFPESPPPFLSLPPEASQSHVSLDTGINFASGGAGLLERTGRSVCGEVVTMAAQVRNFTSLARAWMRENRTAADLIARSLFFISVGSNDLFEYSDAPPAPNNRNDTQFLQDLVASYAGYVKELYGVGAKKFSVVSPSLVGCCPSQRKIAHDDPKDVDKYGCLGTANNLSRQLQPMVASMLHDLSLELPGMNYSLGDAVGMAEWVFKSPSTPAYNFTELVTACCGKGEFGADGCDSTALLCQNRSNYVFWDRYHPTEAASAVTANQLFVDTGFFVHPINVQQLA